jgi:hypothetical protein
MKRNLLTTPVPVLLTATDRWARATLAATVAVMWPPCVSPAASDSDRRRYGARAGKLSIQKGSARRGEHAGTIAAPIWSPEQARRRCRAAELTDQRC